jgi:SAM-dependent methyltransferase
MSDDEVLPGHPARNRAIWDDRYSAWFGGRAAQQWAAEPHWGIWATPESDLHVLPELSGKEVIDLGCGTAYIGAWVMRAGGRAVGIDNSAEQLATAEALQREFGLVFPLLHGNAEKVPLPDNSFDVAAYWDAVAALNTPTDLDDWSPGFDQFGQPLPGAAVTARRNAFLRDALGQLDGGVTPPQEQMPVRRRSWQRRLAGMINAATQARNHATP